MYEYLVAYFTEPGELSYAKIIAPSAQGAADTVREAHSGTECEFFGVLYVAECVSDWQ